MAPAYSFRCLETPEMQLQGPTGRAQNVAMGCQYLRGEASFLRRAVRESGSVECADCQRCLIVQARQDGLSTMLGCSNEERIRLARVNPWMMAQV